MSLQLGITTEEASQIKTILSEYNKGSLKDIDFSDPSVINLDKEKAKVNYAMLLEANGKERDLKLKPKRNEMLSHFFKEMYCTRNGLSLDGEKKEFTPINLSFAQAVRAKFGISLAKFLRDLEIFPQTDTFQTLSERLGFGSEATVKGFDSLLNNYGKAGYSDFANPVTSNNFASTKDFDPAFRFIIPELILQAINAGYQGSAKHLAWVRGTQNISKKKITMPFIKDGDTMPYRVNEGATIPYGSLKFGQKEVTVFKVGIGFDITDELLEQSSIDMVSVFLAQVGVKMGIASDVEAIRVLVNGDQASGAESVPVVGVFNISDGITHKDLDNIMLQMEMLGMSAEHMIGRKAEFIENLNEGLSIQRETVQQYTELPKSMFPLPTNQLMFLNVPNCMMKMQYKGLMIETERDISRQVGQVFVTDFVGFAIIKRDARVILDKTVTNVTNPFPAFMDIEAYLSTAFRS